MKKALFDVFADIYDQDMAKQDHLNGDLLMYLDYARSKILDVGCGTGRIMVPLLLRGFEVDGVDISPKMILKLKEKLRWKHEKKSYVPKIEVQNFLDWDRKELYTTIIMADDVLLHFLTSQEQIQALMKCSEILSNKGILIVDVFRQKYHDLIGYNGKIIKDKPWRKKEISANLGTQINTIRYYYDDATRINMVRWVSESELRLMFSIAGFEVIHCFGDYYGKPIDYSCQKMIFLCQKKK